MPVNSPVSPVFAHGGAESRYLMTGSAHFIPLKVGLGALRNVDGKSSKLVARYGDGARFSSFTANMLTTLPGQEGWKYARFPKSGQ
jgi:hypothetical protein